MDQLWPSKSAQLEEHYSLFKIPAPAAVCAAAAPLPFLIPASVAVYTAALPLPFIIPASAAVCAAAVP